MSRIVLGIDEAGRGAVIGPLVMAGVWFDDRIEVFKILKKEGVKDSKDLKPQKRRKASKIVRKNKKRYTTFKIKPDLLDKNSLNLLEIRFTSRIINKFSPDKVFLDVPSSGKGIKKYCDEVFKRTKYNPVIIGGNKMDSKNIAVSSASIIAKEEREKVIKKLHKKYGDFGSGYPSDPKTRRWLKNWKKNNREWPEIIRTKWKTLNNF